MGLGPLAKRKKKAPIDWMALHGISMPLAITGEEYTWYVVYKEMGFSDEELKDFFSGPAYFGWFWMGNLDAWGGPLPLSWMKSHKVLAGKDPATRKRTGHETRTAGIYRSRTTSL